MQTGKKGLYLWRGLAAPAGRGRTISTGPEEKHFNQGLRPPNWGVETDYVHGDLMAAELWEASNRKLGWKRTMGEVWPCPGTLDCSY